MRPTDLGVDVIDVTDRPGNTDGDEAPVLVVDDDPSILTAVELALSQCLALPLETVASGESAEQLLTSGRRFRLVLMDRMIAGVDGLDLVARMRDRGDDTPVVMVSADATDSAREQAARCGANGYLVKPFDLDQLYDTVASVPLR